LPYQGGFLSIHLLLLLENGLALKNPFLGFLWLKSQAFEVLV